MDPVSALGVASAAVAFIDFAIGIVHEVHTKCGTRKRLTQGAFETAIHDLLGWNITLCQELGSESYSDVHVREYSRACAFYLSACN